MVRCHPLASSRDCEKPGRFSGTDHDCETSSNQEGLAAASRGPAWALPALREQSMEDTHESSFSNDCSRIIARLAPAIAAEDSGQQPTGPGASPEASKEATVPPSGSADTSGG